MANRWGARRMVGLFFGAISRLGDGVFWYTLMAVLALFGGRDAPGPIGPAPA
jgi:undecaprenyl-diphosphatase